MKTLIFVATLAAGVFLLALAASAQPSCVVIDVKPGSCPNAINVICDANDNDPEGVVPVAILGNCCFHVTDICTVFFEVAGGSGPQPPVRDCAYEDVNGDSITDLVCHFRRCDLGLTCDAPTSNGFVCGTITGTLCSGGAFEGTECLIKPVPCNNGNTSTGRIRTRTR